MSGFNTIEFKIENQVGIISLNRPEVRNAFNSEMISELHTVFKKADEMDEVRMVLLNGNGKSFCAGADLNWMREVSHFTYEENYEDSLRLAEMMYALYTCSKPTIARIHGAAIGGGNGLASACDMSYCEENTVFSLSEIKIGLVPSVISPYVIRRIGETKARELMLTGERISGDMAESIGLINKSLPAAELDAFVESKIELLHSSAPEGMKVLKKLIHDVTSRPDISESLDYTSKIIAQMRLSDEGQEGMAAFLEKRKPKWVK